MLERCPECGGTALKGSRIGEVSCQDCGLVIEDQAIETSPFIPDSRKNRAEQPFLAVAGSKGVEGKIYKDSWLLTTREKNLRIGLSEIDSLTERLSITKTVQKEARLLFKKALQQGLAIGRDRQSLVYASTYASCIIHGYPKTPLEMTAYTSMSKKNLLRTHKLLVKKLGLRLRPVDPIDLVPRFASRIKATQETTTKAIQIINTIQEKGLLTGKRPETIVAAAIYLAGKQTGQEITQRVIANKIGMIEVTIRKTVKELANREIATFFF